MSGHVGNEVNIITNLLCIFCWFHFFLFTIASDVSPVACGDGYACEYDNDCLANAAGFVGCLPVEEACPAPGTGITCCKCTLDNFLQNFLCLNPSFVLALTWSCFLLNE